MELPVADVARAMRRDFEQRKTTLRRIATCYVIIGCVVAFFGICVETLEAVGLNLITMPASGRRATPFNASSILPSPTSPQNSPAAIGPTPIPHSQPAIPPTRFSSIENAGETPHDGLISRSTPETQTEPVIPPAIVRFSIPSIDVSAPVAVYGVGDDGVMQSPNDPSTVAWYDFSANPIQDGNAVFAGHVDFLNAGPAVFWRLVELVEGDQIVIGLADGTSVTYQVTARTVVSAEADRTILRNIVGQTAKPSITVITCIGRFDDETSDYKDRLVVRAERL